MRFIHTADWQIGKPFKRFGDRESVLRQARLVAIENIGRLAAKEGAAHVLVAGDVYDTEAPTPRTLLEPLERMRRLSDVQWHMLPGNHDPHRPKGVWDRVLESGPPANVHLHLKPEPVDFGPGAMLLPAPLTRKPRAPTSRMDGSGRTPPGAIRIGVAHGSVVGFGSGARRPTRSIPVGPLWRGWNILPLAIGTGPSRSARRSGSRGTPEPDRAGGQEAGQALVVEIPGPGAPANVTSHKVGSYRWLTIEDQLSDAGDLKTWRRGLRGLPGLSSTILRLWRRPRARQDSR